jgi:hypothetical protein
MWRFLEADDGCGEGEKGKEVAGCAFAAASFGQNVDLRARLAAIHRTLPEPPMRGLTRIRE